ncbi:MAG: CBS domain-containing protein [Desulfobacteraceae bacterium]|nr:MAG: CBS domain-containing protein [Desulfobacteraceae bacterium]
MLFEEKVRDRMIPIKNYSTVPLDASLKEAALSLRTSYCRLDGGMCAETGPRTILVLDEKGRLAGILDFRSFLKTLIPEIAGGLTAKLEALGVSMAFAQADASEFDEARLGFNARVVKNAEVKVRDVMLRIRGTIQADSSLMEALKEIYRNKITVLPVYEGEKLVGVLRDTDLFLAVSDILNRTPSTC